MPIDSAPDGDLDSDFDGDPDAPPAPRPRHGCTAALVVLALLPLVLTAAAQPFLPESVPLNYGLSGPDRWGPKTELFVVAGGLGAIGLFVSALFAVSEHQRATGREDWIIFNDSGPAPSFPLCAAVLGAIAAAQAAYVAGAFGTAGFVLPENGAQLLTDTLLGLIVLVMWGSAAYMLVTGRNLVALRPKPTELERRTGDDKRQARALGALLLALSVFAIVEWAATR